MNAVLLAAVVVTNIIVAPPDREFAAQAGVAEKAGKNFDQIFAQLCQLARDKAATNPKLRLDDSARAMFGGLWHWANSTGNPRLQGRKDWAQHFIGGGAFEGYLDAGARAAGHKEKRDSQNPGNRYDLDDLAATLLGARWMNLAATGSPAQTKRWLELWATGKLTLTGSIPKLQFGQMPQLEEADADRVQKVHDFVNATLQLPPEPAPAGPPPR